MARIAWQERRLGMGLLQPLQDRRGLGQDGAVHLQGRHEPLRVQPAISLARLLPIEEVDGTIAVGGALQVQGDAGAVACARAPVSMQNQRHARAT
jgi:hypothetical protein